MLLYLIQLLGVAVFACSGCVAASRKQLDLIGITVVAVVTGVGGGTLRDLLLDQTVFWIEDPIYLVVAAVSAGIVTLYARFHRIPKRALRNADALGLALFVISGTEIAELHGQTGLIALAMGVITGTAGGAIRDLLCAEIPFIMRPGDLYATAAVAGSGSYLLLAQAGVPQNIAAGAGMAICASLRFASIIFGIRLPVFKIRDAKDEE